MDLQKGHLWATRGGCVRPHPKARTRKISQPNLTQPKHRTPQNLSDSNSSRWIGRKLTSTIDLELDGITDGTRKPRDRWPRDRTRQPFILYVLYYTFGACSSMCALCMWCAILFLAPRLKIRNRIEDVVWIDCDFILMVQLYWIY